MPRTLHVGKSAPLLHQSGRVDSAFLGPGVQIPSLLPAFFTKAKGFLA